MISLSMQLYSVNTIDYNWDRIINAVVMVESNGNPNAYNPKGDCVGILQIRKVTVREVNNILMKKGINKRYTYHDRWDVDKSKEMFIILQEYFNGNKDIERIIKSWKYGFYRKDYATIGNVYYRMVMKHYKDN